jgi:phage FluMu gp28-like protein
MQISIHGPQSAIQFFHGQNPELLEGEACDGYIIDEAAKQKYEVYSSARTTLTVTQGPLVCISTPVGKNWFYRKCMEAKDHMEWSLKNNKPPSIVFLTAPTSANPFVPKASIDFARKQLPDNLFRQYYLAEFIDDASVFSNIEACLYTDLLLTDRCRSTWYIEEGLNKISGKIVIGVDWAKTNDFCVFIAYDVEKNKVVGFFRTRSATYRQLVGFLKHFCSKFDNIECILHDKTGIGAAIDEMLSGIGYVYHGIVFNNTNKCEMVSALIIAFQNRWIQIPYWEILVNELKEYEVRTNQIGMMFYSHPAGRHDDTVTALMLAYHAASSFRYNADVFTLDNIPDEKNQLEYDLDADNLKGIEYDLYD